MPERPALQQFHYDKRPAVVLADIVNGADVRVIQRRGGAGLTLESLQRLALWRILIGQKLQGDVAAKASVFGFVDDTHTARPEFFENSIVGDGSAGHALACH